MKNKFSKVAKACAFIAAGFLFASQYFSWAQIPILKSDFRVIFAHGEHTSQRHRKLLEKLQKEFNATANNSTNFHKKGATQLLLGLQSNPLQILFPYQQSILDPATDRFFNFGSEGFILAGAQKDSENAVKASVFSLSYKANLVSPLLELQNSSKNWHSIEQNNSILNNQIFPKIDANEIENAEILKTAQTILRTGGINCLAKAQGRKQTDKQFVCDLESEVTRARSCKALGIRSDQPKLEVFASGPSRCYFFHAARDSRYSAGPQLSKLVCINTLTDEFDSSSSEDLRFIYPEPSGNTVLLYHTDSSPHRVFRFHMNGFKREEIGNSQGLGLKTARGNDSLTDGPLAYYGCKSPEAELQQLYLFPTDIYTGLRSVTTSDIVWKVQTDATRGLLLETLTYKNLMNLEPELDKFPSLKCLQDTSLDVKCALKSLQFAAQISWEEKQGVLSHALSPELRIALLKQCLDGVQKINIQLPNWQLKSESTLLETFFAKKLNAPVVPETEIQRNLIFTGEKQLSSYLSLPQDFWTLIKSEIQPK